MKIKKIEIFHIDIPIKKSFETSFGVVDRRPLLIFKIVNDSGMVGYGESSPLYIPISEDEILDQAIKILIKHIKAFIDVEFVRPDDFQKMFQQIKGIPVSRIGLEGAYYDLLAKEENKSLYEYFGATKNFIEAGESVGIKSSIEETLEEINQAIKNGFKRVKLKIKPGIDIVLVDEVRKNFPALNLGIDPNASYSPLDMDLFIKLDRYNLFFIEQPFQAEQYVAHAQLRKKINAPVCLDETVRDITTCKRAVEAGSCDIVNIKPARIGSYTESIEIHNYCYNNQISLFGGGRMESSLGKIFNASIYALPGFDYPSDMTPPLEYFVTDTVESSLYVDDGKVFIPDKLGVGALVQEENLSKFLVKKYDF